MAQNINHMRHCDENSCAYLHDMRKALAVERLQHLINGLAQKAAVRTAAIASATEQREACWIFEEARTCGCDRLRAVHFDKNLLAPRADDCGTPVSIQWIQLACSSSRSHHTSGTAKLRIHQSAHRRRCPPGRPWQSASAPRTLDLAGSALSVQQLAPWALPGATVALPECGQETLGQLFAPPVVGHAHGSRQPLSEG